MRPIDLMTARPVLLLVLAGLWTACADVEVEGIGPDPGSATITLEIQAQTGTSGSAVQSGKGITVAAAVTGTDNAGNELRTDTLHLVLDQLQLKRSTTSDCTDSPSPDDGDDCAELIAAPAGILVPLEGGLENTPTLEVPAGTYDRLDFRFHVLRADSTRDTQILQDFSELERTVSIRLDGSFNGDDFEFFSDLEEEVEVPVEEPLVLEGSQNGVITLQVDVLGWFKDGNLIDPRTASSGGETANPELDPDARATVEDNIRSSFSAVSRITE